LETLLKSLKCTISEQEWIFKHHHWILWKLAHFECLFPKYFVNCLCTYDSIFEELVERYERELNLAQRSILKRIIQKDENPAVHMILSILLINGINVK